MSVTIDLPPEVEASLADHAAERGLTVQQYVRQLLEANAAARGVSVQQYVRQLLDAQVARNGKPMSSAERAALWRQSTAGLPHTAPLSDQAIDRETIYETRG